MFLLIRTVQFMFAAIQFGQWTSALPIYPSPFVNFLSSEQTKRIKETAIAIFSKIADFFTAFKNQSNEINIKAIAMISCLSLVALLVISMLRRRDT